MFEVDIRNVTVKFSVVIKTHTEITPEKKVPETFGFSDTVENLSK